jgi:hypothetical protein
MISLFLTRTPRIHDEVRLLFSINGAGKSGYSHAKE